MTSFSSSLLLFTASREALKTKKILFCLFTFFLFFDLIAGGCMTVVSLIWMFPSTPQPFQSPSDSSFEGFTLTGIVSFLNLVLLDIDVIALLIAGVVLVSTFFAAIPAVISKRTAGLTVLNFGIMADIVITIVCSGIIWYRSLRTRVEMEIVWNYSSDIVKGAIETHFKCCGYSSSSDLAQIVITDTCPSVEVASTLPACIDPFPTYANLLFNNVSTLLFLVAGLMGIWVVINGCIISERKLAERFRRIDEKRTLQVSV